MARIWTNLRTPSRDNPGRVSWVESLFLMLLVFGTAILIVVVTVLLGWYLLGGRW